MSNRFRRVTLAGLSLLAAAALVPASMAGAAAAPAGPDITVVGFGLAAGTEPPHAGYQLNLSFQVSNPSLARDLADLEAAVRHAIARFAAHGVPRDAITVQAFNVNLNNQNPLQVQESLDVNFPSIGAFERASVVLTRRPHLVALQNYYLSTNGGGPASVSRTALRAAYAAAFRNARATASAMARAQGLTLGAVVAESEGQPGGTPCGMGGVCPVVSYPGPIGPGQTLEQVTVTFATVRNP